MASFFSRSTPIGNEIIAATRQDGLLDVAKNLEIVDMVDSEANGPTDATRALLKRLAIKDRTVAYLAVKLLEMLVKNCGRRFHVALAKRDFMASIYKLVAPRANFLCKDEILDQLQMWVHAFGGRSDPAFAAVYDTYEQLVRDGVEFPDTDLDSLAPIHTPKATHPVTSKALATMDTDHALARQLQSEEDARMPPYQPPVGRVNILPAEASKLQGDFEIVRQNIAVVNLSAARVRQGEEGAVFAKPEFDALRSMQERVVVLLEHVDNEEFASEALALNDEINTCLSVCNGMAEAMAEDVKAVGDNVGNAEKDDDKLVDLMGDLSVSPTPPADRSVPVTNPFHAPSESTGNAVGTTAPGWPTDVYANNVFSNQGSANDQGMSLAGLMSNKSDSLINFGEEACALPSFEDMPVRPVTSADNGTTSTTALSNDDFDAFLATKASTSAAAAEAPANVVSVPENANDAREKAVDELFGL